MTMNRVESVKVGDKVEIDVFDRNGFQTIGSVVVTKRRREEVWVADGSIGAIDRCVHLRNITGIVECGPGNHEWYRHPEEVAYPKCGRCGRREEPEPCEHEWKPSCVAEPHTQCMTARVCTRCGKREEPKPEPEPVCWKCGCRKDVHWYKGSHARCSAYAHDRRKPGNDRRKSNTSMYSRRVGTLEVGASYRYTGSGWDQRGTMKDRRRG